jgi:hypothetical protein
MKIRSYLYILGLLGLLFVTMVICSDHAEAATVYWAGGDANNQATTDGNWDVAPVTGDSVGQEMNISIMIIFVILLTLVNLFGYYERIPLIQLVAIGFALISFVQLLDNSSVAMAMLIPFMLVINVLLFVVGVTRK